MNSKKFTRQLLVTLLLTIPALALADGIASLRAFYADTNTMQAEFNQVVTDRQGRKVQEVHGEMQLKRPNQFRWDYHQPFEQKIISDGKQVWLYDTELAQVTVRSISKALGSSPAALLAGGQNLEQNFKLSQLDKKDDLAWVSAVPQDQDTGFEKIQLGFRGNVIQKMLLVDSFGHETNITFTAVKQNPAIDKKTFVFKVPKNVDVVGE